MALIEVEGLHCGYGADEIIHGVDFRLDRGEVVTILGPNGCGKTTFIKAILGYVRVTTGRVLFDGRDITRLRPTARVALGLGYVPQLLNVFRPLSVAENLEMGGYSLGRTERNDNLARLFEMFPVLAERRGQSAATLSGGERQLLAMARAMMVQPTILFLDEPSAGLSPVRAAEVFDHIRDIAARGTAIVIVEQDVLRALAISARGYVLVTGEVVLEGPADRITTDERIRTAYLGGRGPSAPES